MAWMSGLFRGENSLSTVVVSLVILACMLAGMLLGLVIRRALPDHHTRDESRDMVKTAAGMMATLVALIIGLLVSSAKSSFDTANSAVTQGGAKVITLDHLLAHYGAPANDARDELKEVVASGIERIWPSGQRRTVDLAGMEAAVGMDGVFEKIRALNPTTPSQEYLKSQALSVSGDLMQSRRMFIEQSESELPMIFLVVLTFWLSVLFLCFGMLSPVNGTALSAMLVCTISMAAAIFIILELNHPLEGTIKVSSAPMEKALSLIGK
jgi:hypothetical protein